MVKTLKLRFGQAFEAEVASHSNAIVVLDNTGMEMINQEHFQRVAIKERLDVSKITENKSFILIMPNFLRPDNANFSW